MATATVQLSPAELKLNEEFFLRDVPIIARDSKNREPSGVKRKYLAEALRCALPMFEGEIVNANHDYSIQKTGKPRLYSEAVGILQNVRFEGDGLVGDVQLNPHKPLSEAIRWDYRNKSKKIGLSFMGQGDVHQHTGNVVAITEIELIDVVQRPSTTTSLREAEEIDGPMWTQEHHDMLMDHHRRLAECETKLAECMSTKAIHEAELKTQIGTLLAEVEQLKKPKPAASPHIHPDLTLPAPDLSKFAASLRRQR